MMMRVGHCTQRKPSPRHLPPSTTWWPSLFGCSGLFQSFLPARFTSCSHVVDVNTDTHDAMVPKRGVIKNKNIKINHDKTTLQQLLATTSPSFSRRLRLERPRALSRPRGTLHRHCGHPSLGYWVHTSLRFTIVTDCKDKCCCLPCHLISEPWLLKNRLLSEWCSLNGECCSTHNMHIISGTE